MSASWVICTTMRMRYHDGTEFTIRAAGDVTNLLDSLTKPVLDDYRVDDDADQLELA